MSNEDNMLSVTNELLKDSIKVQNENYNSLKKLFIIVVASYTVILTAMVAGFFVYEGQYDTERTMEVYTKGDSANANVVEGNQYNDSATHNQ